MKLDLYYFIASLPMLEFGGKMPFSPDHFVKLCREHLSVPDVNFIQKTSLIPGENTNNTSKIIREWKRFDSILRNELARARALKHGKDFEGHIRGTDLSDPALFKFAKWVLEMDAPLEMELAIDRLRWQKIEELEKGHYFDLECLAVYKLHLLILEKWSKISAVKGLQILRNWMETNIS